MFVHPHVILSSKPLDSTDPSKTIGLKNGWVLDGCWLRNAYRCTWSRWSFYLMSLSLRMTPEHIWSSYSNRSKEHDSVVVTRTRVMQKGPGSSCGCDYWYAQLMSSNERESQMWCFTGAGLIRSPAVYALRVRSEGQSIIQSIISNSSYRQV